MEDETRIDEALLQALFKGVYGEAAEKQFRMLYHAVSEVITSRCDEAWDKGYDAGEADGIQEGIKKVVGFIDPTRAPTVINDEAQAAAAAQTSMDEIWGAAVPQ